MDVQLNSDMGESFGIYHMGNDEGLMRCIHIANVACGFHAGDPLVMQKTVRLAKGYGVKVGAHPSLPDLQGFGRREMKMRPDELTAMVLYQVGALKAFLDAERMPLNHIKPHGSLYGMAARDEVVANAVCDAVEKYGVPLYGMAGTLHEKVSKERKLSFFSEFYADLDYDASGGLIITREHKAVDPGAAVERVLRAIREGVVRSQQGPDVRVRADIVCVHSDTPGAVEVAKAIREALDGFPSKGAGPRE
ncbi:LamB/YcsF family protein [Candidatus Deferrimicrobium sp.]|uniref:LamB/YcsF family protein n=1 Tax=Candidatus Deferrimicrobium sp. TaxID=3060586 RepID=UPI003C5E0463